MEFEICLDELQDLDLPEQDWHLRVQWSYDPDYSPREGLYDKYCFELQKHTSDGWVDITDDLTAKDTSTILKMIEGNDNDDIL
jgi:hypothetical protein